MKAMGMKRGEAVGEGREMMADTGTEPPVQNRGVPAGIRPDFPDRGGIFTGTKTSPFCPGFCTGMGRSGRNGTGFITLATHVKVLIITPSVSSKHSTR